MQRHLACFKSGGDAGASAAAAQDPRVCQEIQTARVRRRQWLLAAWTFGRNKRLAWIARQPIPSTEKLEQKIDNEDRQLKRLTERLTKLDDTHLDAVLTKAEEMDQQLAAKRRRPKELQRAGRWPNVKGVKEKDVVAALGKLRDLLLGDVGVPTR